MVHKIDTVGADGLDLRLYYSIRLQYLELDSFLEIELRLFPKRVLPPEQCFESFPLTRSIRFLDQVLRTF